MSTCPIPWRYLLCRDKALLVFNVVPKLLLQEDIDQQETRQVPWGLIELIWREKISPVEIDVQLGYHRKGDIENKRSGQTDRGRMSRSLV